MKADLNIKEVRETAKTVRKIISEDLERKLSQYFFSIFYSSSRMTFSSFEEWYNFQIQPNFLLSWSLCSWAVGDDACHDVTVAFDFESSLGGVQLRLAQAGRNQSKFF